MAEPAQRAQPEALDRPLVRDSSGAAKGGVAGPDAGARGLLQLRGVGGAEPRGAGERHALGPSGARRIPEDGGGGQSTPYGLK